MSTLKNGKFWIGAIVGVVVVMYVWPMLGGALRGGGKGDGTNG